jgi:hypothetical protein
VRLPNFSALDARDGLLVDAREVTARRDPSAASVVGGMPRRSGPHAAVALSSAAAITVPRAAFFQPEREFLAERYEPFRKAS